MSESKYFISLINDYLRDTKPNAKQVSYKEEEEEEEKKALALPK